MVNVAQLGRAPGSYAWDIVSIIVYLCNKGTLYLPALVQIQPFALNNIN